MRLLHACLRACLALLLSVGLLQLAVPHAAADAITNKITVLRAQAARVQAAIDAQNTQIELLAERFDAATERLQATVAAQRATARQLATAEHQLAAARRVLDGRVRAIYIAGPESGLAELLGAATVPQALDTAVYQERVVAGDDTSIAVVAALQGRLVVDVARLAADRRSEQALRATLQAERTQLGAAVGRERTYQARVGTRVHQLIVAEQHRQAYLAHLRYLRQLAIQRAIQARLAAERAAQLAAERAARAAILARAEQVARERVAEQPQPRPVQVPLPPPAPPGAPPAPTRAAAVAVAFARAQLGKPYQWGGNGPYAYDCSGLTQQAYLAAGIYLPRTANEQYADGFPIVPSIADLEPGDLVFYGPTAPLIHHVGIYVGGGMMIDAPYTGAFVRYDSIMAPDYFGAVRPSA